MLGFFAGTCKTKLDHNPPKVSVNTRRLTLED